MKLLSLALALVLALPPQDKIRIKFNPKQGDKLQKTERMEMTMKAKVVAGDQEQELEFEQRDLQKATLEYVEVAGGAVTRAVFDCKEHIESKKGPPTLQWEKTEKPLHGRKITMSMKDGKIVREGAEGLEEKVLSKLDLTDRASRIFPKDPVGPGDAWELQGDDVRKFLGADGDLREAKIKAKFLSVKEVEGRKCAVLSAQLDLLGKAEGDVDLNVKLDVEIVVWIERGYTLSVKGKGNVTMKAENAQFKFAGQGPMTLELTSAPQ